MAKRRRVSRATIEPLPVITIRALAPHATRERLLEAHVGRHPSLERLARDWTYILRARARWVDDMGIRPEFRKRALRDLETLGVSRSFMKDLTECRHVEVELHRWKAADSAADAAHECAAAFPWEYLINCATRGVGRHDPQLITRLFRHPSRVPATPPTRVLFIESAPGRLEGTYDFASERQRIGAAVGADGKSTGNTPGRVMEVSATETVSKIRRRVREGHWDVLHLTGIDNHQAAWCVEDFYGDESDDRRPPSWAQVFSKAGNVKDGMVLRETNVAELPLNYEALADALIDPKHPPSLVTLNLYYSGSRIARELVNRGAHAALGFLDEIDDELAERFFQAFYWEWYRPARANSTPEAFLEAWRKMRGDRLHGTAIVIWLSQSAISTGRQVRAPMQVTGLTAESRSERLERHGVAPVRELLQVELEAPAEVNYSLLHNDRPLLGKLTLTKLVPEALEDISVQVELNLGAQNYPYRCTELVLDEPQLALAPRVKIPLTATLPRALRERVQSTVYVKVCCGGRTAWESTERVTLIPVDEWVDDTASNPWLPSFVLPRDPAVQAIIGSSRRYLVGIRDDPAAGFDGYQSVDDELEDPSEGVDAQVQAIWTALVNEYRLQYINPPPAYSEQSQRLRTPSDIVASNSGTCIDLALLVASCLEYVDIYPVLVLLTGHAFVGYWRSDEAHEDFAEIVRVPTEVPAAGSPVARSAAAPFVDPYGWRLTRLHYNEILDYVVSGDLVMLEATLLTSATSFAEAVQEGRADMRSRREFDSLLDIRLARSATPPVTPLPIIND